MTDTNKRPVSPVNGQPLPRGRPFQQGEQQRETARKAGKRSAEVKKQRKTLREDLLAVLTDMQVPKKGSNEQIPVQEAMAVAMIRSALNGNVRAYEIIRDTVGEKPIENVNIMAHDYKALDSAFSGLMGGDTDEQ